MSICYGETPVPGSTLLSTGGAEFAASFGPGRYSVFACVDFRVSSPSSTPAEVTPTEYGAWLGNFPVRFTTNLQQVYFGKFFV